MTPDDEKENIVSRWSKRKRAVENEQTALAQEKGDELKEPDEIEKGAESEIAKSNRLAAQAVDLDKLDENTDFSIFMKQGVPKLLQQQAMAALWRSNPVFANVDGLVDYGEDFGSPDLIMKTFKSAYQSGRGYLEVVEAQERDKEKAREAEAQLSNLDDEDEQTNIAPPDDGDTEQDIISAQTIDEMEENEQAQLSEVSQSEEATNDLEEMTEEWPQKISLRQRLMPDEFS